MKKSFFRVFIIMSVMVMLLASFSASVNAASSGTCGKNLTWTFDSSGTLTISGTGDMDNYSSLNFLDPPWDEKRDRIKSIIINEGVTSIGDEAFAWCENATRITIPDGVTSIGKRAFRCCYSLISIAIPDSVISIGEYVFDSCELTSINVNENNPKYTSVDGNLFNKDKTILIQYAVGKTDSIYTIPSGVARIGDAAFSGGGNLTSIIIPNSVTSIGCEAFYFCNKLTCITIPDSVTSIGDSAFDTCMSLTNIIIPDSVTSLGNWMFSDCYKLASITIPDSVTCIGDDAFYYCYNLKDVYYSGNSETWSSITINDGNGYLLKSTIHYSYKATAIGLDIENGKITILSNQDISNALIPVATYTKAGQMLEMKYLSDDISVGENEFECPVIDFSEAEIIKVMMWKNFTEPYPMFDVYETEI